MKNGKYLTILLIAAGGTLVFFGCGKGTGSAAGKTASGEGKVEVVTTLFPLYDFVRHVGKDRVSVSLLLPPGVEAHSFEPKPQDVVKTSRAKVFVFTGDFMEPWVKDFLGGVKNPSLIVTDTSKGIEVLQGHGHGEEEEHEEEEEHGEEEEHEEEEEHGEKEEPAEQDPHIWLDPVNARRMVDSIGEALGRAAPESKGFFEKNAEEYKERLADLDKRIAQAVGGFRSKTILYGGHFAFGYFAKRYGLEHVSPYAGFSPNAEPTPQRIARLSRTLKDLGLSHIFHEELIDPRVAEVISKETGAELLLLHGAHNISREELEGGITYLDIMERNLANLKKALE